MCIDIWCTVLYNFVVLCTQYVNNCFTSVDTDLWSVFYNGVLYFGRTYSYIYDISVLIFGAWYLIIRLSMTAKLTFPIRYLIIALLSKYNYYIFLYYSIIKDDLLSLSGCVCSGRICSDFHKLMSGRLLSFDLIGNEYQLLLL